MLALCCQTLHLLRHRPAGWFVTGWRLFGRHFIWTASHSTYLENIFNGPDSGYGDITYIILKPQNG